MNHWEMENAIHVAVALKDAGFEVSQICCCRLSCFDFVAKKRDFTVLLKVASDIDSFPVNQLREVKVVASRIPAASLLIGQQSHGKPLDDDTVYSRNNVNIVNPKTIISVVEQTGNPLVYAGPGGYTVQVYGEFIKRRREELGLSIGKLAALVGVSRRTIYGYEHGMARASVTSAIKLGETLGIPVVKPINVFEKPHLRSQCLLLKSKRDLMTKLLLRQILKKFNNCNISPVHNAPFDFVMNVPGENYLIIGGVATADDVDLNCRVKEILSICRVIYAYPVLITENPKSANKDLSCFSVEDLSVLRSPEELIASS